MLIGPSERSDDSELCAAGTYKINRGKASIKSKLFRKDKSQKRTNLGPSVVAVVPGRDLPVGVFVRRNAVVIRLVVVLAVAAMATVYPFEDQLHVL